MELNLRGLLIRLLTRLSWATSRRRMARGITRFSQVEADSGWQMLRALDAVDNVESRARLFNNALEEVHHSALFRELAHHYSDEPPPPATQERIQLFNPKEGMIEFSAWHYVGEADVYRDFLAYAHATREPRIRDTFLVIRGDEKEHQALALAELQRLTGSPRNARRLIRKVRIIRAYQAWMRFSKGVGNIVSSFVLAIVFIGVGWIFAPVCRRRIYGDTLPAPLNGASGEIATSSQTITGAARP